MLYNFLNNSYTVYENVETPRVSLLTPLTDNPIDISNWSIKVTDLGTPIVKNNIESKMIINNNEEINPLSDYLSDSSENYTKRISSKKTLSNALDIMNKLVNKGLKPHEAAGVVGSLIRESGLNPGSYNSNDVGLPGGGIAGFRGENFSKLKAFANSKGKSWKDIDTQLDYLLSTIGNTVKDKLSKSTNPYEASEAWADYERYAGYDGKLSSARSWQRLNRWSDEKTMQWITNEHKIRGDYAKEVYNLWKQLKTAS